MNRFQRGGAAASLLTALGGLALVLTLSLTAVRPVDEAKVAASMTAAPVATTAGPRTASLATATADPHALTGGAQPLRGATGGAASLTGTIANGQALAGGLSDEPRKAERGTDAPLVHDQPKTITGYTRPAVHGTDVQPTLGQPGTLLGSRSRSSAASNKLPPPLGLTTGTLVSTIVVGS